MPDILGWKKTPSWKSVTRIQFTGWIENEYQILYVKFYMHYWLNFFRYVGVTWDLNFWRHHGGHVTWVQFTDQIEDEPQILYLKFYMGYWLQALSDMLGWQKNYIHHIITMVTSSSYKIYRLDWKCFLHLVSQVLHALLT